MSDEARLVRVSQVTDGAAFLALSLAAERFGTRPLVVSGTEGFRKQVAMLAGQKELAKRAKLNGLATTGSYSSAMESQAA